MKQWYKCFKNKKNKTFEIYADFEHMCICSIIEGQEKKKHFDTVIEMIYGYDEICDEDIAQGAVYVSPEKHSDDKQDTTLFQRLDYTFRQPKPTPSEINELLELGADPNLKRYFHGTAIFRAIEQRLYNVVPTLIQHGADVDVVQKKLVSAYFPGSTPVTYLLWEELRHCLEKPKPDSIWDSEIIELAELMIQATQDIDFHAQLLLEGAQSDIRQAYSQEFALELFDECYKHIMCFLIDHGASKKYLHELETQLADIQKKSQDIQSLSDYKNPEWFKKSKEIIHKLKEKEHTFIPYLFSEKNASSPDWYELMRIIIEQQPTFEETAKGVYGEAVSMEDDEGHLCQDWGYGDYSCVTDLLKVLALPEYIQQDSWTPAVCILEEQELLIDL